MKLKGLTAILYVGSSGAWNSLGVSVTNRKRDSTGTPHKTCARDCSGRSYADRTDDYCERSACRHPGRVKCPMTFSPRHQQITNKSRQYGSTSGLPVLPSSHPHKSQCPLPRPPLPSKAKTAREFARHPLVPQHRAGGQAGMVFQTSLITLPLV